MGKAFSDFLGMLDANADSERFANDIKKAIHDVSCDDGRMTSADVAAASMLLTRREILHMLREYHEWLNS